MIAVVVPTIRYKTEYQDFLKAWDEIFIENAVELITVQDGINPIIYHDSYTLNKTSLSTSDVSDIMGDDADLIYNESDSVRNVGFAYIAKELHGVETIITLDDDVRPYSGDPIKQHTYALSRHVPVSWMSTASEYMRGFPYAVRSEAEVVLSHGVWHNVPDWDGITQFAKVNEPVEHPVPSVTFPRIPIPKGVLFPMCIMNVAFKRKLLPYIYQAPAYDEYQRFSDIWAGINAKKAIDENGWAAVTGYSSIEHIRASNVFKNIQKEAKGLELNETYWQGDESDPYFKNYNEKRKRWEKLIKSWL